MDAAAVAGLCAVLAHAGLSGPLPQGVTCPPVAAAPSLPSAPAGAATLSFLAQAVDAPSAREAIARVAYAEAGNQGDSGLAAVVYAILNRLADGRWGASVDAVLNAHAQFEPVMRAGGDWRGLRAISTPQQARIDTILNLALDGRLPDLTNGARYFQNPAVVARRARDGEVSPRLVNFGGATPSAVIGAHTFYVGPAGPGRVAGPARTGPLATRTDSLFVGDNRAGTGAGADTSSGAMTTPDPPAAAASDSAQALFVDPDGVVRAAP